MVVCVGLKTREERLLGEEDALGGGAGIFFVFQIEGHNEQQRRYRI